MADAQGILQRVFDDGAQALRVLLGGTVSDDAPSSPVEGDFWYESDTGSFFVRVGGSWVEIAAGTGTLPGLSDVTVTAVADKEVLAYDSGTTEWINQTPSEAGLVAKADYDANTILAATSDNTPAALTVAEQTLVGRVTGGAIDDLSASAVRTLLDVPTTGEAVLDTLYDANTIVAANTDNTPAAVTVAEQRIVGRITGGNIDDLTGAQAGNVLLGGAWTSYTPAITALDPFGSFGGAVNPTMGTGASLTGAYVQVGRMVVGRAQVVFGTGAAAGTGYYGLSLPVTPRNTNQSMGLGFLTDVSDSARIVAAPFAVATVFSTTLGIILVEGQINLGASPASHAAPWTWADTDSISLNFIYEASADA